MGGTSHGNDKVHTAMKITIACVGKIKEKYLCDAIEEYSKRLSRYCNLSIKEVPDEKAPQNISKSEEDIIKNKEGERLSKHIQGYTIALAIDGEALTSEGFSALLEDKKTKGISSVTFVIGGSLGLSDEILKKADMKLSFSKMTFPHMLMRVILLEQLYRANKISNNEPYHK